MSRPRALLAALLLSLALGCASEEAVEKPTDSPPLAGSPAKELVGTWKLTSGGESTIELKEDGACRIQAVAQSPGGTMKSDVSGEWTAGDGKLNIRRQGTDKLYFTAVYVYKLNGSELELAREGSKTTQKYAKAK